MADTRQIVTWALEKTCGLRHEKQATSPREALGAVGRARAYSDSLRNKERNYGIYGDVYVTSYTHGYCPNPEQKDLPAVGGFLESDDLNNLIGHRGGSENKRPSPAYPASGFLISEEFKNLGGPAEMFSMGGNCHANLTRNEIAGCCGTLGQWPDSPETEEQIRGIISRFRLGQQLAELFPQTTPIWYGLWAVSPIPRQSLELLRTIISTMRGEDALEIEIHHKVDKRQLREFELFVKATEVAEQCNIPLHVKLLPLGHTDFGWYTIFPHCPFCKAAARVKRWERKYPTALYDCHVCGRQYSPAETARSERMDEDRDDLRELLGLTRFLEFAKEYLMAHGETSEDADAVIRATEAQETERQEKLRALQELHKKKRAFLLEHIFEGLQAVSPPPSEDTEDEPLPAHDSWYDAKVFTEILHRCEQFGVLVQSMTHDSEDGATDRQETAPFSRPFNASEADRPSLPPHIKSPEKLLRKWQVEGCNGKFRAHFNVPDAIVR